MLWNTLLKKAYAYVQEFPGNEGSYQLEVIAYDSKETVSDLIFKLDIRDAGALRALLPSVFPKKLRTGPMQATKNIHGAWRLDPTTPGLKGREPMFVIIDEYKESEDAGVQR